MVLASAEQNKEIYTGYHDEIIQKRFLSSSVIRSHAHRSQYQLFVDLIPTGSTVLDAGCGEGVLSVLLAQNGCTVTGVDLSEPNIEAAKNYAEQQGVLDKTTFLVGDAEHLPAENKSFDYVVSSHVLEHVPDFVQGVRELSRVARVKAIAAVPTCFNLCSMVLLGGDKYWIISRKTLYGLPLGFLMVLYALIMGKNGVNEGYADKEELIHIRRFPWRGKHEIEQGNVRVDRYCASSFPIPYIPFFVPLSRFLLRFRWLPIFRDCGYGVTYVCTPL